MTVKPLVQLNRDEFFRGSTPLRQTATRVTDFGDGLSRLVDDLLDTLHDSKIAVGLAAPQIGVDAAVAVINLRENSFKDIVLVNPKIISESGKRSGMKESCMSLPHFRGEVVRRHKLTVQFSTLDGDSEELSATGFLARVIAHEVDHLNGVLYIDRMEEDSPLEPVEFFE